MSRTSSRLSIVVSLVVFLAILALAYVADSLRPGLSSEAPTPGPTATRTPGSLVAPSSFRFDFWVLALSWSPDYCATDGADDVQQCSPGRKLGFVLHGLWPQYNTGYPSYCSQAKLPPALPAVFPNLYPNTALYAHEWEKHGTCSGLGPEGYLAQSAKLKDAVAIPAAYRDMPQPLRTTPRQIKSNILAANQGMKDWSLAVFCSGSGRYLQELWVCFGLDGQPTACSSEIRSRESKSCQASTVTMRNMR